MAGAWIFQGNPKYYDVAGAARTLPRIDWVVREYKTHIEAGDTAYIWETGGAGFVARAVVTGVLALGYDDAEDEDPFRRQDDGVRDPSYTRRCRSPRCSTRRSRGLSASPIPS